ncbi:hypothetical protein SUGI_1065780 [Cryptomeria japonica]|nr:hypothetical protein SUGI_1065780 [Cryptomeria japonica]
MREHIAGHILRSLQDQIPRLTQSERDTLSIVGLWYAILMPAIRFHPAMLMALMERWDPDTCTFHLLVGELMVTLEDVYRILHLPIRGATVTYATDRSAEDHQREQVYCIGRVMPSETRGRIMVSWLLHPTGEVPLLRRLMIAIIALAVYPNGRGTHMHGGLTWCIKAMERHRRVYAWGRSMLAHLYHDLEEYVFGQGCSLMTCTLLQVWILEHFTCTRPIGFPLSTASERPRVFAYPLTSKWRFGDLLYWRVIFDRLTVEVTVWRPYLRMHRWDGMERQLACLQRNRLLRGRYAHIIVPFNFDRVRRQFGLEQCVPADVPIYTRHSRVLPRPRAVARPTIDDIETTNLEGSDQDVVTDYSTEPGAQRRYVSWFIRSYLGPIFPPDHPTGYPGPWRHGDQDEDQGSRSEEPEEGEEAGDPDPPTECKAEKSNPSRSPLPNSEEGEGRVTRVDGFHLGGTLHSKEGLKPTRSNPTQCKIGFYVSFKGL